MIVDVALALVCAWSQPHCDALKRLPIEQADQAVIGTTVLAVPGVTLWNVSARTPIKVVISTELRSEATAGVVLAHESTELLRGWVPVDCGEFEGTEGEEAFAVWYSAIHGWPEGLGVQPITAPVRLTYDESVWQHALPGNHQVRPC